MGGLLTEVMGRIEGIIKGSLRKAQQQRAGTHPRVERTKGGNNVPRVQ